MMIKDIKYYDISIIGGGSSGMMASIFLKDKVSSLCIIEKNEMLGKKLRLTGNGHCNILNTDIKGDYYSGGEEKDKFIKEINKNISSEKLIEILRELGIEVINKDGYIYPYSGEGKSVTECLVKKIKSKNIDVFLNTRVEKIIKVNKISGNIKRDKSSNNYKAISIEKKIENIEKINVISGNIKRDKSSKDYKTISIDKKIENIDNIDTDEEFLFIINTSKNIIYTKKLVIATGSPSFSKDYGDEITDFLKSINVKVNPFIPALCGIYSNDLYLKDIKGIRVKAIGKILLDEKEIYRDKGEIQINKDNFSGIPIMNLSRYYKDKEKVLIELLPDYTKEEVLYLLLHRKETMGEYKVKDLFLSLLPEKLGLYFLRKLRIRENGLIKNLENKEMEKLVSLLKNWDINPAHLKGFLDSQCSSGGVFLGEISIKDLSLKKDKKIYILGETMDICGKCGGYNLYFAFSSGLYLAKKIL